MNLTWDLDIMYHGYEDPRYDEDIKLVKKNIEETNKLVENLDKLSEKESLEKSLILEEELTSLISNLYSYSSLRVSANVNDFVAMQEMGKLQILLQETVPASVKLSRFIKSLDLEKLAKESVKINEYLFILKKRKEEAKHMLSEKEEVLATKLSLVGSSAWEDLQSQATSNLKIKVEGIDEVLPLSSVRNLAYDKDPNIRKNAYLAELKSYDTIGDFVAMSLNNIKREVNIMCEARGYKDALEKTLQQSNVSEKTLNALIEAINEELPNFRRYFKLKAEALGHKNGLPFYDLFAPMGRLTKTYSIEEAKNLVLEVYRSFSESLYLNGKRAFEERWIDFLPREGKVGGAFCAGVDKYGVSRVLTNFTGSLNDISTLAHELGHAYHGKVCLGVGILNRDYPMPLAETASILCETLMAKKLQHDITDKEELLTVVESSLQGDTQCVVDILSRFLFEKDVLSKPVEVPLSKEDMCKMMLDAQDKSYGDGLDPNYKHPYMWLCKSHYYSAGLNYYNWPYAFGMLYGKGLYKQYLKNKDEFVKNYDQMLRNTGMMNAEEVAAGMGIDVTKKEFWIESLKFIEEDIDLFEKLLKEQNLIK